MKNCSKCRISQDEAEFCRDTSKKDLRSSNCKTCRMAYQAKYYRRDAEKWKARRRDNWKNKSPEQRKEEAKRAEPRHKIWRLKHKYDLSPEEYSRLLETQGGVCDICKKIPTGKRGFSIDHDHRTNKVRGLLCSPCNTALGLLKESVVTAQSLIEYIKRHFS